MRSRCEGQVMAPGHGSLPTLGSRDRGPEFICLTTTPRDRSAAQRELPQILLGLCKAGMGKGRVPDDLTQLSPLPLGPLALQF